MSVRSLPAFMRSQIKYRGFTLIEMLIVMAIFTAIFGISISAFSGLRTSIQMNQRVEDIKQNMRWVQRAAVLLKRDPGENWVYGIGVDFSNIYTTEEYQVFKWCANGEEFNETPGAQSYFPSHLDPGDNDYDLVTQGTLPFTDSNKPNYIDGTFCDPVIVGTSQSGRLASMPTTGSGLVSGNGPQGQWLIDKPLRVGFLRGIQIPAFILFESVTGNVFFYDQNGVIMNYESDGVPENNPIDLTFVIATPNGSRGQKITIAHDSGKVTVESVDQATILTEFDFDPPLGVDDTVNLSGGGGSDQDPPVGGGGSEETPPTGGDPINPPVFDTF